MLRRKVEESILGKAYIKGHFLHIEGATAYANSSEGGALRAGFMDLWTSGARCKYMHAYDRPLEMAGFAIGR